MHHFFVRPDQIIGSRISITGADVNHIKNVLRLRPGEEISVSNGTDQKEYRCHLEEIREEEVQCRLRFVKEAGIELPVKVYLFQGVPKGDKMEMIIQKNAELGIHRIIPVFSTRCVIKLDAKKQESKRKRWQGISEAAAKQSRRLLVPEIAPFLTLAEAIKYGADLDLKLIPYELAENISETRRLVGGIRSGQSVGIYIGPEGGFAEEEIAAARAAGILPITLGRRILRTETAGMALMSWLMFQLEEA